MIKPTNGIEYLSQSSAYLEEQVVTHQCDAKRASWRMIPQAEATRVQRRAAASILAIRAELDRRE